MARRHQLRRANAHGKARWSTGLTAFAIAMTMAAGTLEIPAANARVGNDHVVARAVTSEVGSAKTASQATAAARAQKKRVEIIDERDSRSSTYAEPDGNRTTEYSAVPFRVKRKNKWINVDPTLRMIAPDRVPVVNSKYIEHTRSTKPARKTTGSIVGTGTQFRSTDVLSPRVGLVPVRISRGGQGTDDEPLAEVQTSEGRSIALYWPDDLPRAEVSGQRASYGVSDTERLTVTALDAGFDAHVILSEPPAAAPVYRFPIHLDGVKLEKGEDGGYAGLNPDGKQIFAIAPPVIWDSKAIENPEDPDSGPLQVPLNTALVADDGGNTVLELRPDLNYLRAATYPVTIDPKILASLAASKDTWVKEGAPTTSYSSDAGLRVGYTASALRQRAYIQFEMPVLPGRTILASTLKLREWDASSCTPSQLNIYPATSQWAGMTWSSGQPTYTTSSTYAVTQSFAHGYEAGGCGNAYETIDVKKIVKPWIEGSLQNLGFVLRANSETSTSGYKGFCSFNYDPDNSACNSVDRRPILSVTYNTIPSQATSLSADPAAPCVTGAARPFINTTTPVLKAAADDLDKDPIRIKYEVWPISGSAAVVSDGPTAYLPAATVNKWSVPLGILTGGATYKWRARGDDGSATTSPWSAWCELTVDVTNPTEPAITSDDYPANTWSPNVGAGGTVELTPGADGGPAPSGIHHILWALDNTQSLNAVPTAGAPVSVPVVPASDGKHVLYAQTVDVAGNRSGMAAHTFYVGQGNVTSPQDGDRSARRFKLTAQTTASFSAVKFQYRRSELDPWLDVPDGTVSVLEGKSGTAVWDAVGTLGGDGAAQVRAIFGPGTSQEAMATPIDVTIDTHSSVAAKENVGPGSVDLQTGDFSLNSVDASYFGVSITRTARSRFPQDGLTSGGLAGPFGAEWNAGALAAMAANAYTAIRRITANAVEVESADSNAIQFTRATSGGTTVWVPEVGREDLTLLGDPATGTGFTLKDSAGSVTKFQSNLTTPDSFDIESYTPPGTDNSTLFGYEGYIDASGAPRTRISRITAPNGSLTSLASCITAGDVPPPAGCRTLRLDYSPNSVTPPQSGSYGNYPGRLQSVSLWATDPSLAAMTSTPVTSYTYDAGGRLHGVTDPRTPAIKTTYEYDGAGRVITLTPAGEKPWNMTYGQGGPRKVDGAFSDENQGRLLSLSRATIDAGPALATWSVVYEVPLTAHPSGRPKMDKSAVETWGQAIAPANGTALFPPDLVPNTADAGLPDNFARAEIHYLDVNGREINTSIPGGGIATREYDEFGNLVRELTPENRERALRPSTDVELITLGIAGLPTWDRAALLSNSYTYDATGQRMSESYGPLHQVRLPLPDGRLVSARHHDTNLFDEGRPSDGSAKVMNVATTKTSGARVQGSDSDVDLRSTHSTIDWTTGATLSEVDDSGGNNLTKSALYDPRGRMIHRNMPSAVAAGHTDGADSSDTIYYDTPGSGPCAGHPEWDGMICQLRPSGAIVGANGNPSVLPTITYTYSVFGEPSVVEQSVDSGGSLSKRTSTTTYDAAGRVKTVSTTATGVVTAAVPIVSNEYDPLTGRVAETRGTFADGTSRSIQYGYDLLGRPSTYVDSDGGRTETAYNWLDQIVATRQFSNGANPVVTSYSYDTLRQIMTGIADPLAGTFQATLDTSGNVVKENLPGGVTLLQANDPTGSMVNRTYTRPGDAGDVITLFAESVTKNVHDQWRSDDRSDMGYMASHKDYAYDGAGRLTGVVDSRPESCERRAYTYDSNSNRTGVAGASGLACPDSAGAFTANVLDTADRLQNPGFSYDVFGRTTNMPSEVNAPLGTAGTSVSYYANDMVQMVTQATKRESWALDAALRLRTWKTESKASGTWQDSGSGTNHFEDDSDTPAWTVDADGSVTRNVIDLQGGLAVTTKSGGQSVLMLSTLHGDVAEQLVLSDASHIDDTAVPVHLDSDEFGRARVGTTVARYSWLGAAQRAADDIGAGVVLMGARLYAPSLGRFLSADAVEGGSANAYDYARQDPCSKTDIQGTDTAESCGNYSYKKKKYSDLYIVLIKLSSFTIWKGMTAVASYVKYYIEMGVEPANRRAVTDFGMLILGNPFKGGSAQYKLQPRQQLYYQFHHQRLASGKDVRKPWLLHSNETVRVGTHLYTEAIAEWDGWFSHSRAFAYYDCIV